MKRIFWIVVVTAAVSGVAEFTSWRFHRLESHYRAVADEPIDPPRVAEGPPRELTYEEIQGITRKRYSEDDEVLPAFRKMKQAVDTANDYRRKSNVAHSVAIFLIPIIGLFLAFPVLFWPLLRGISQGARLFRPVVAKVAKLALGRGMQWVRN